MVLPLKILMATESNELRNGFQWWVLWNSSTGLMVLPLKTSLTMESDEHCVQLPCLTFPMVDTLNWPNERDGITTEDFDDNEFQ
jgi:hypothetical protein